MSVRRVVVWVGAVALAALGGAAVARRLAGEPYAWQPAPELTAHYDAIVRRSFAKVSGEG